LLAKAVYQATSMLTVLPSSRASSLLQGSEACLMSVARLVLGSRLMQIKEH